MDAGNIASLGPLIGSDPFSDSIYDKGDNVRASDGFVLGEHIAKALGADLNDNQLFNIFSTEEARPADLHNYAHGGAQSGEEPSQSILGMTLGIGLSAQVRAMKRRASFYRSQSDVDVLLSIGGNDILAALDDLDPFATVLATSSERDDKRLVRSITRPITRNIRRNVDAITGLVDEILLLSAFPMTEIPRVQKRAAKVKGVDDDVALQLFDAISDDLHQRLTRAFRNQSRIVLLQTRELWDELSKPGFVDDIHPDSRTSRELAKLALQIAIDQFEGFGFG